MMVKISPEEKRSALMPESRTRYQLLMLSLGLLALPALAAGSTTPASASTAPAAAADSPSLPAPAPQGPVLTPGPVVTAADPWSEAIAAFATADAERQQDGGVVFVGSSSFRLWNSLETQFKQFEVVNRGFGGSTLADCLRHLDRLVLPHKPRLVVIYAGDNDLAMGRSPQQVLEDFTTLASRIHERLPKTEIAFVSIKPSPARVDLLGRVREANTRVRDYVATQPYLTYIDVFTPMLNAEGHPRAELFVRDSLHLNEDGYALWSSLITPMLPLEEQPAMIKGEAGVAPAPPRPPRPKARTESTPATRAAPG